ncbi:glycosyltransferase 87 family protein [Amycolatopsis saalfeldensis]|uniref:Mannosyltransferase related to Gpi18 n=1 Tax=Amycolatopsis saalfeldensis TaxID=394193 RepID=A0A1H8XHQ1_9PSEU|nr:glycosyltransferase 87 family protein [Amycolatopsis saalfeldensis]SEP39520.1 Mannosyltransferase related to Gpi18 [Amycolatopsis saalfeldensis]
MTDNDVAARPKPRRALLIAVAAVVVLGGLAVRTAFFSYTSGDYRAFVSQWYEFIKQNGGFSALKYTFANYNTPYLYLLAILTHIPVPALYGVKAISVLFDLVLAFFTYRIVALRYPGTWWPLLAGAIVLYLPTVVLNSAAWAQVDSAYSAFGVGGVYFVLRKRPWLACVFFGLAFAFKLQAVFFFPALLLLVLRKRVPWPALLLIPAVYLLLDVPALIAGANFGDLLKIYLSQSDTYDQLTLNAPNVYQYFSSVTSSSALRLGGIVVTGLILLALMIPVVVRRSELTPARIVLVSAISVTLVPYFLPAMHERYFYPADALSVIAAFYLPRRLWAFPILEQFASGFAYAPYLLNSRQGGPGGFPGRPGGAGGRRGSGFPGAPGGTGNPGGRRGGFPGGARPGASQPGQQFRPPGGGNGGLTTGTVLVDFWILSTAMLAGLVLAVWAAVQDFRREPPVPQETPQDSAAQP